MPSCFLLEALQLAVGIGWACLSLDLQAKLLTLLVTNC